MSEALLEIMEPLIEPIIAERIEPMIAERIEPMIAERERTIEIRVRKETKEEAIKGLVAILHDLGNDDNVIRAALKKQYDLSAEEINKYL